MSYAPFIAASKDRIVSRGRSNRGRVGLDRSGSVMTSPFASRCCIARIDSRVTCSTAVAGCASLIAFDGSAFEVTLCAAFSLDVSVKLALEKDPILLRFLLLVKLRTDLARGLR